GHIAHMLRGVFGCDEIGIVIVALIIQNLPKIKSCRLGHQVPFANNSGFVTIALTDFGQCFLAAITSFSTVAHESIFMAVLAREYGCSTGATDRIRTIVIHKDSPVFCDAIDMRCGCFLRNRVSICTNCLFGMVITHDEKYIWTFDGGLCEYGNIYT